MTNWASDIDTVATANEHVGKVWDLFSEMYLSGLESQFPNVRFWVNANVLEEAVRNAVVDIARMSKFHLVGSGPDNHKLAAFFSMWIARFRPIHFEVVDDSDKYPPDALQVNAQFAFFVFRSFLVTGSVPDELAGSLIYMFHYRTDTRPEVLAPIAYSCEEISRLRRQLVGA